MLRISRLLEDAYSPKSPDARHGRSGYVVIWNLTDRCNLSCYHCYANAKSRSGRDELSTQEAKKVIDDLASQEVLVLILSGGEPILRHDLYELAKYAREKGILCALSTNGTLIDETQFRKILECGIDYVGISIDGTQEKHDEFRGRQGAYEASLKAIRLCRDAGIKVGLRFSLTSYTASQLPSVFDLFEQENLVKLYISHMNYSNKAMKHMALEPIKTRESMNFIVTKAMGYMKDNTLFREIVTGNNNADAPFLMLSIEREDPDLAKKLYNILMQNGGCGSSVRLANIDPWGDVHPDPFCRNIFLGNVKQTLFGQILTDPKDSLILSLRDPKGPFNGRCGNCRFVDLCAGNSRARAFAQSDDWWGSDPSCYLKDEEISIN